MTEVNRPPVANVVKLKREKIPSDTRERLQNALQRLIDGLPLVVKPGGRISPTSVAKEAGVDRVTLYRYHEPILLAIKSINRPQVKSNNSDASRTKKLIENLRELAEVAQKEVERLAKINYRLNAERVEMSELLNSRDRIIQDLRQRLLERDQISTIIPLIRT